MPGTSPTLAVLLVHAVLSALVLSVFSVEVFEYPKALLLRATAVALGVAAAWGMVSGGRGRLFAPDAAARDPLLWCGVAFLASGVVSGLLGVSPRRSLLGSEGRFDGAVTWLAYGALFVAARHVVRERAAAGTALLYAAVAASAGVAAYGALQALGLDPIEWAFVHRFGDQVRHGSTLGNPTFAGAYLAMTTPVALMLLGRAWQRGHGADAGLLVLAALGGVWLLAATLSRGAWLALAVALLAQLALLHRSGERRDLRILVVACSVVVLAGCLFLLTPSGVRLGTRGLERLARMWEPAREPRAEFWQAAVGAFRERPWLGAGPDTFSLVYPAHQSAASWPERFDSAPEHAHNGLLQLAASQGLVGLGILGAALACLARAARRAYARAVSSEERDLLTASIAVLVAWAVGVQFLFTVVATGTLAALAAGLVAGRAAAAPSDEPSAARGAAGAIGAAGVVGAGILLVGGLTLTEPRDPTPWLAAAATAAAIGAVAWTHARLERSASGDPATASRSAVAARGEGLGRGVSFLAAGLAAVAAAQALQHFVLAPFLADAWLRRGTGLLAAERPAEAIPYLEEATRRTPGRERAWLDLGVARHRAAFAPAVPREAARDQLLAARAAHEKARELEPADPLPHANRARVLADLARLDPEAASHEAAAEGFAEALALAPRHPQILEDAAKAALLAQRPGEAEVLARRALETYPQFAAAWSLVAGAAMARGELEAAEELLRTALRSDWHGDRAARAAAWANLATVLAHQGRADEAREAAAEAQSLRRDAAASAER